MTDISTPKFSSDVNDGEVCRRTKFRMMIIFKIKVIIPITIIIMIMSVMTVWAIMEMVIELIRVIMIMIMNSNDINLSLLKDIPIRFCITKKY